MLTLHKTLFSLLYTLEEGAIMILILLKRKPRHREIKQHSQAVLLTHSYTVVILWWSLDLEWAIGLQSLSVSHQTLPGEVHDPGAVFMNVRFSAALNSKKL